MKIKFSNIFVISIILFILLIFFKSLFEESTYIPKKLGSKIENISFKEFYSNSDLELKNFFDNDNFILINIWASLCVPCREEHKYITTLSKINNIKIIGLNYKDKKNNAQKFLNELGNPYDIVLKDTDGTKSIFLGAYGVPETFVVDRKLNIIKKYIGPINSDNVNEIKKLIK